MHVFSARIGFLVLLGVGACGGERQAPMGPAAAGGSETVAMGGGENAGSGGARAEGGRETNVGGSAGARVTAAGGSGGQGGAAHAGGAGGSATGGTGGVTGTSGAGGGELPAGACRGPDDCAYDSRSAIAPPQCLSPYAVEPATPVCGAPGWCGECGCPSAPAGWNLPCTTDDECSAPGGANETASRCVDGHCEVCGEDADCPAGAPHCIDRPIGATSLRGCAQ